MKRLLCFFDGTWNRPDGSTVPTNVAKLARVALGTAPDGTSQITRYVEGIGTDHGDSEYQAFIGGAVGVGIDRRILEGYKFLVHHYRPGDEICLFGFSRGAFQARSLSGLITTVGLLRPEVAHETAKAWAYYERSQSDADPAEHDRLRSLGHEQVRIRCLGVWDTVGNLGLPLVGNIGLSQGYAFHDTELSPLVDVGLHALAIDEPRGPFSPTLWTRRPGMPLRKGQIVEQVWFAGSHANVGGGFADSALSDLSLLWMAERAGEAAGVAFDLETLRATTRPDPLGELVAPTSDGFYRVSGIFPFVRLIGQDRRGISPWRRSILGTHRTSWLGDGTETVNESVHPSAMARFGQKARWRRGAATGLRLYEPRPLAIASGKPALSQALPAPTA